MKGVRFGSLHSYNDFGLILNKKEIGSPEVKKVTVDIEGADGSLDYTDYFGEPKFSNRQLTFEFSIMSDYLNKYSAFLDAVNGQRMNIVLDDDLTYYYIGRVSCSALKVDKKIGKLTVKCDCDPYKMKSVNTISSSRFNAAGTQTITLNNLRKRVVPEITTTTQMTIAFDSYSKTVSAGTFKIPELELSAGSKEITVTSTGAGTITFTYREGRI